MPCTDLKNDDDDDDDDAGGAWKGPAESVAGESKKNAVMNFLEAQQSEYGQGKKKRHKK